MTNSPRWLQAPERPKHRMRFRPDMVGSPHWERWYAPSVGPFNDHRRTGRAKHRRAAHIDDRDLSYDDLWRMFRRAVWSGPPQHRAPSWKEITLREWSSANPKNGVA